MQFLRGETSSEIHIPRHCTRFKHGAQRTISQEGPMIYLKLRAEGCKRKDALHYSSKSYCRTDVTKEKTGPPNFRHLKIKKNPFMPTTNGWKLDAPEHELGKKYHASTDDILNNDFQSKYFEQHFRKHERKIQHDYKKVWLL